MIDIDDGKSKELGKLRITGLGSLSSSLRGDPRFYFQDRGVVRIPLTPPRATSAWLACSASATLLLALAVTLRLKGRQGYEPAEQVQKVEEGLE